jgi:hypothetical protein
MKSAVSLSALGASLVGLGHIDHCRFAPPHIHFILVYIYYKSTNLSGASISEETMRPDPRWPGSARWPSGHRAWVGVASVAERARL